MNAILEFFAAALNTLWQAALAAALVWIALRVLPRFGVHFNAATRFVIWWAVLALVLILPVAPRAAAWLHHATQTAQPAAPPAAAPTRVAPLLPAAPVVVTLRQDRPVRWPYWVLGLWAALCLYRLSQIGRSYFYLRGVKRRAALSALALPAAGRAARLLMSDDVGSPMAVGFLHPAVVLPSSLPEEITPQELDHVLLHEMAHLARRDDWTNLAARFLAALLILHPVAWFILREIEREREAACDDWVVARTGEARPYAASLARMFELRMSRPHKGPGEALASGIFGAGSRLGARIEALLKRGRDFSSNLSTPRIAASALALLGMLAAASAAPRWIAFAQSTPRFEVASVRPSNPDEVNRGHRLSCENGTRFDAMSEPLRSLIDFAYGPRHRLDAQIAEAPRWIKSENVEFTVDAKPRHPVTADECRLMLQSLLADRFKLSLHSEIRQIPVYVLSVDSKGAKVQAIGENDPVKGLSNLVINGDPIQIGDGFANVATGRGITMDQFGDFLSSLPSVGRPVLNETGLSGTYGFSLNFGWSPRIDDDRPDIFTAVKDQLGLKLESTKGSVEVLVIDHVEKPDAN